MIALSLRRGDSAARTLSYLGLIPFIAGALATWPQIPELRLQALNATAVYGAVILSFIGAVHWGRVIAGPSEDPLGSLWLIWAVVPSLSGWFAVLLPDAWTMPILIAAFAAAWYGDRRAVKAGLLPDWYGRMRNRLTLIVCACLAACLPVLY